MASEHINPRMLAWARETAGMSVAEAAEKLGLSGSPRASAHEKLMALETGQRLPTQNQLLKAAAVYRRPLIAFYMAEPPARGDRGEDFRAATAVSARDNALLDALVRDVRARQEMLRSLLEDQGDARPQPYVASARVEHGAKKVAAAIRTTMAVTPETQKGARNPAALFALLREAAERIGIYVLLLGDVGSHHSDIGEDVFRGFALSDEIAPMVVINDNDAQTARSFTLLHELAHIWIGATGISGPLRDISANAVERFCNDVAGEFLIPPAFFPDLARLQGAEPRIVLPEAARIATTWNVSEAAVIYRFARNQWIAPETAASFFAMYAERWRRDKQRAKDDAAAEGGPTYYALRRHRLGRSLLDVVRRGLREDVITHTRAAKILGVSPSSVEPLLQPPPRTRAA